MKNTHGMTMECIHGMRMHSWNESTHAIKSTRAMTMQCTHAMTSPMEWIDSSCFYYFVRNSLVALLEALCARKALIEWPWNALMELHKISFHSMRFHYKIISEWNAHAVNVQGMNMILLWTFSHLWSFRITIPRNKAELSGCVRIRSSVRGWGLRDGPIFERGLF